MSRVMKTQWLPKKVLGIGWVALLLTSGCVQESFTSDSAGNENAKPTAAPSEAAKAQPARAPSSHADERAQATAPAKLAQGSETQAMSKEEYLARMKSELSEWNDKIAAFKTRAEKATSETREQLGGLIAEMERKREAVVRRLAEYEDWKSSATLALEDMKEGVERAMRELRDAYEKAKSRW